MAKFISNGVTPPDIVPITRILTMTGDVILTESDRTIQKLDPNGANRTVTLPPATSLRPLRITNTGNYYLIRVNDASGGYVIDVDPGATVGLFPDGVSEWIMHTREPDSQHYIGQMYTWGTDVIGNNQFYRPFGHATTGNAGGTIDNAGTYQVVTTGGVIDEIFYFTDGSNQTNSFDFFVNGVVQRVFFTVNHTTGGQAGGSHKFLPLTVSAGDRLAIRNTSGDLGRMQFALRVKNSTPGYLVPFGGNVNTNNAFYGVAEDAGNAMNTTALGGIDETIAVYAPAGGGNFTKLSYAIDQATTADFLHVYIGGVLAEIVSLAGGNGPLNGTLYGTVALTTCSFVNGDLVQILQPAAAVDGAVILLESDVPGDLIVYKGNPGPLLFVTAWHSSAGDGGTTAASDNRGLVIRRGRPTLTWYSQAAMTDDHVVRRTSNDEVRRNRQATAVTNGALQGTAEVSLTFEEGESAQLMSINGVGGVTCYGLFIH